ncbi:MAG: UDP-N-acetyl glucosamine 2-epimerase [Clostridia bacterium]|nr:UDP-N-acetyl glucosamine 2-epimerase [Clostridia bacterium]
MTGTPSFANDGRLKLLITVGTRPEIIRLSAVIKKCRECFDTVLCHTGQNYDHSLNGIFFEDLELDPPDVGLGVAGGDLGESMGNIIAKSYSLMSDIKPDALLVLGDTNSCLCAIPAKRLHIPVFHMEAGNRCRDERLPEETNRRIVDVISDVNMAYSERARDWLLATGLPAERVFVTGSPMAEVLSAQLPKIEKSGILGALGLEKRGYMLLSAHREENIDDPESFRSLFSAVNSLAQKYDMPVLYSCHPRSAKMLDATGFELDRRIIRHEPLGFTDYNCLQMNAFAVLSDSGTLPEESSFYTSVGHPFPAVSLRTSTERPEALDKGCFVMSGIGEKGLYQAVQTALKLYENGDHGVPVPDYTDTCVSAKVVKIIQSYTGIIKANVWRERV